MTSGDTYGGWDMGYGSSVWRPRVTEVTTRSHKVGGQLTGGESSAADVPARSSAAIFEGELVAMKAGLCVWSAEGEFAFCDTL